MRMIKLAVNGTLMRGLKLNGNLVKAGAVFVKEAMTEPCYRLWSIDDIHPAMKKVLEGGESVEVEVWDVPAVGLAGILLQEPLGLCIGLVKLADGEAVLGVIGEDFLIRSRGKEITSYGGWRSYMAGPEYGG
ncbi:MAG: hypothetical protein LBC94_02275 [Desulfovibrio sp.]|nr:hypothetical protein [Desulfovibrio sp.]